MREDSEFVHGRYCSLCGQLSPKVVYACPQNCNFRRKLPTFTLDPENGYRTQATKATVGTQWPT